MSLYTDYKYAVNVKSHEISAPYACRLNKLDPDLLDCIIERFYADFWADAEETAKQFGYDGVWQEGRSGGWCVPYIVNLSMSRYIGQGMDPEDIRDLNDNFESFKRAINILQDTYEADFQAEVEDSITEHYEMLETKRKLAVVLGYN